MKTRSITIFTVVVLTAAALAACSSGGTSTVSSGSGTAATSSASGPTLATRATSLGTIVVDGKDMTAYFFDRDIAGSGRSVCTGACSQNWPAITTTNASPTVSGISAKVGTIPAGNVQQLTIDGRPVYTYSGDQKPGDTNGQGVQGSWHVISPTGQEISTAPTSRY